MLRKSYEAHNLDSLREGNASGEATSKSIIYHSCINLITLIMYCLFGYFEQELKEKKFYIYIYIYKILKKILI